MSKNQNHNGISLLFDTLNSGEFNIFIDFNLPDESACKSFAFVLSMLERGKLYEYVLDKLKDYVSKNNKNLNDIIQIIIEHKKTIDSNLDIPAVLPRDVFKRIQGV